MRKENLERWRAAVLEYADVHRSEPNGLFEVYIAQGAERRPRLLVMTYGDKESALLRNEQVMRDKQHFERAIDYVLVRTDKGWRVRERRIYPSFYKNCLAITHDGRIEVVQDSSPASDTRPGAEPSG